jgi:hypothetical protein
MSSEIQLENFGRKYTFRQGESWASVGIIVVRNEEEKIICQAYLNARNDLHILHNNLSFAKLDEEWILETAKDILMVDMI